MHQPNFLFVYWLGRFLNSSRLLFRSLLPWHPTCPSLARIFLFLKGDVSMRLSRWKKLGLAGGALLILSASSGRAQSGNTDESKRKVKTRVSPVYPELAKRMNIGGKVKIEVVISPDGRVKTTRVVGGHPLLVQVCQDAVREWKFAPAPEETTQIVEFEFCASE